MSDTMKFEVLDELPEELLNGRKRSPHVEAVLQGKKIFLPGLKSEVAAPRFQSLRNHGMRVRTRAWVNPKGVAGVVVWGEKIEDAEEAAPAK